MAIRAMRNWASRVTLGLVGLVLLAGMLGGLGGAQPARAAQASFSNPASVAIPSSGTLGPASLYPSPIVVSGLTGPVSKVTVDLKGLNHGWTADIQMLLVGPGGQQFLLWGHAAGSGDLINVNVTLDDAAGAPLPLTTTDTAAGTYLPTSYTHLAFPSPAPALSGNPAAAPDGTATFASVFNGINPNGTWNLFIQDTSIGDAGSMTGGWTLNITTISTSFTVSKVYSPSGSTTPVSIGLSCVSGTVTSTPLSASPGSPAVFTVTGYTGDPNCTATESPVPAGYTSAPCTAALVATGSCTITNTLVPGPATSALLSQVTGSGAPTAPNLATYLRSAASYLAIGTPTMKAAACQQLKQFKAALDVAARNDQIVATNLVAWKAQADAIRATIPCVAPN